MAPPNSFDNPELINPFSNQRRHPEPGPIGVGGAIGLGRTDPMVYLWAMAENKLLSFPFTAQSRIHAIPTRITPAGRFGQLELVVTLAPASCIQLAERDSCAIITIELKTGGTTLICNRTGKARVTQISLEPICAEGASGPELIGETHWVAFLEFRGASYRRAIQKEDEYAVGERVPVRLTAASHLVTM